MKKLNSFNYKLFLFASSIMAIAAINKADAQVNDTVVADTFEIHTLGHGSLMFGFEDQLIYVDPWSQQMDNLTDTAADFIFITHPHPDHFDTTALGELFKDSTILVVPQVVADSLELLNTFEGYDSVVVMNNWDSLSFDNFDVLAVPAYNLPADTSNADTTNSAPDPADSIYHVKGAGNGYVFTFGEKRVYVGGDTENIPELDSLGQIDIAFLPMNLPYTMTPEMAADAAKMVNPDILFIYHFGNSDTAMLRSLLTGEDIEIRFALDSVYYESTLRGTGIDTTGTDTTGTDTTGTDTITVNILTRELEMTILYPNPVKEVITVENQLADTWFYLYDVNGRMILSEPMEKKGQYKINLGSIPSGTYIVKIRNAQGEKTSHILKE